MTIKPWKVISSRTEKDYSIFSIRTDRVRSPRTNREYDFYTLMSTDWINVIPITPQNEIVLIRQYRHGIRQVTLEIPGGMVGDHDTPEEAARRELKEETGYQESEMILIGRMHPNPAIHNNYCYTYLAKDVTLVGEQELDDREDIEVLLRSLDDIPRMIREREITHSLILAAFYRYYMEYLPKTGVSRKDAKTPS